MALDRKYDSHAKILRDTLSQLVSLDLRLLEAKNANVVIYTDASCSLRHYRLGIMIIIDGRRWYLNSFAPQWILDAFKTRNKSLMIINQLELLAILCAVLTFGDLLNDRRV